MPAAPASRSRFTGVFCDSRIHTPAISPRIIVPSVGMKLGVRHPPSLYSNRLSHGNRFRNHWSNLLTRLKFLFQCAANPVKLCWAFHASETPTVGQSKFAGAAGYNAHNAQ